MNTQPTSGDKRPRWPGFGAVFAGYLFANLVGPIIMSLCLLVTGLWNGVSLHEIMQPFGDFVGWIFIFSFLSAWPGFLILRYLLFWQGRTDWASFVIAGMLNAVFSVSALMLLGAGILAPTPIFFAIIVLVGGAAGLTAWFTERSFTAPLDTGETDR